MNNNQFAEEQVDSGTEHSPINSFEHAKTHFGDMETYMEPTAVHINLAQNGQLGNPHMTGGQQSPTGPMLNHQVNITGILWLNTYNFEQNHTIWVEDQLEH